MNTLIAFAGLALGHVVALASGVTLTQISTPFNGPIGIDYHEPTDSVITSVNYPGGNPHNLVRINFDGTHSQFSTLAGLDDELKIAAVRPGNAQFAAGTIFTGNGVNGQIVKVAPDGSGFNNPWVTLPGGNGLMRGSLFVDRSGVFGGDLIAVTTAGEVWRINAAGAANKLASLGTHLEGVMTVPNAPGKYGPLAGKIIAGAENQGLMYAIDALGNFTSHDVDVNIEDIDMIDVNENFFGVNYGTGRILGAPASEFTSMVGDILLTQEFGGSPSGLFNLHWNGSALVADPITLNAGSATVGQWEHVTFAPAGIKEIPDIDVPEVGHTAVLTLLSLGFLVVLHRRTSAVA